MQGIVLGKLEGHAPIIHRRDPEAARLDQPVGIGDAAAILELVIGREGAVLAVSALPQRVVRMRPAGWHLAGCRRDGLIKTWIGQVKSPVLLVVGQCDQMRLVIPDVADLRIVVQCPLARAGTVAISFLNAPRPTHRRAIAGDLKLDIALPVDSPRRRTGQGGKRHHPRYEFNLFDQWRIDPGAKMADGFVAVENVRPSKPLPDFKIGLMDRRGVRDRGGGRDADIRELHFAFPHGESRLAGENRLHRIAIAEQFLAVNAHHDPGAGHGHGHFVFRIGGKREGDHAHHAAFGLPKL